MTTETLFISAPARLAQIDVPKALRHMATLDDATVDNIMVRSMAAVKRIKNEYGIAGAEMAPDMGKIQLLALVSSIIHLGDMNRSRTKLDMTKPAAELVADMDAALDAFVGRLRKKRRGPSLARQMDLHHAVIARMRERGFSLDAIGQFLAQKCGVKGSKGGPVTRSYLARWVRENLGQNTPETPAE